MVRMVSLVLIAGAFFALLPSCVTGPTVADGPREQTRYIEALPPPEPPVIVIGMITNQSGVSDLDALADTLNETIVTNLGAMAAYRVLPRAVDQQNSPLSADYVLDGLIDRGTDGKLHAEVSVTTTENEHVDILERPIASLLDVFEIADLLSAEVTRFFVEKTVAVGSIGIVDTDPPHAGYVVSVDGETVGAALADLTLLVGNRAIEIRHEKQVLFSTLVEVVEGIDYTLQLRDQPTVDLSLQIADSFPIPGAPVSPHGITWDGERYWVVNESTYEILALSPDGELVERFQGPPGLLTGIAFADQDLWIGTFDSAYRAHEGQRGLYQVDRSSGEILSFVPCLVEDLTGLTWDGDTFWFGDFGGGGLIHQVGMNGRSRNRFPSPSNEPLGMVFVGEFGLLFSVDNQSSNLSVLSLDGKLLSQVVLPTSNPIGLCWDGEAIVIVERDSNQVLRMIPSISIR